MIVANARDVKIRSQQRPRQNYADEATTVVEEQLAKAGIGPPIS